MSAKTCEVYVTDFVASDNHAIDWYGNAIGCGGGVFFLDRGRFGITNATIERNVAPIGGVMVVIATPVIINGTTLWRNNSASVLGACFMVSTYMSGPIIYPVFDGTAHTFINNMSPMGCDADFVTEINRIEVISPAILHHTSGNKIVPELEFALSDARGNRYITAPLNSLVTSITIRSIGSTGSTDLSGTLDTKLDTHSVPWSGLVVFSGVVATSTPGTTVTYTVAMATPSVMDTTLSPFTSFNVTYRLCDAGEQLAPTPQSPRRCDACTPGRASYQSSATTCDACPRGTVSGAKSSNCTRCSQGTNQPSEGQSTCFACSFGKCVT